MAKDIKGCQNKTADGDMVLAESQAPKGKKLSKKQFDAASHVRLSQLPKVLATSYIRIFLALKKNNLPYVHVATGKKGRPPIEVAKAVALKLQELTGGKPANVVDASDQVEVPAHTVE